MYHMWISDMTTRILSLNVNSFSDKRERVST